MNRSKRFAIAAILGCMVIIAGITILIIGYSHKVDNTQRAKLLQEAGYASLLVTPGDIAALKGNDADLASPVYQTLKDNLTAFRAYDPDIRFVYVLGYHPDLKIQFFYVDSESPTSEDYSPPGQLFADTRQYDIDQYLAGMPYTDGPYKDSWGEWVSGYAPVKDNIGAVVGLVGIDIATHTWRDQVRFITFAFCIIGLLLCAVYLLVIRMFWRKAVAMQELWQENQTLTTKKQALDEIQAIGQLGTLTIYFGTDTIKTDERLSKFFGSGTLSLGQFLGFIHPDDRVAAEDVINDMKHGDIAYNWFDARMGTAADGYRRYHIYGNINGDDMQHRTFSGIMQDVSDLKP